MKKTVLALTTALLLAGSVATTASAQTYYYDGSSYSRYGDVDRDGVPNRYDRYDNRYEYDRWGHRIISYDRDCDGMVDRYDPYAPDVNDVDCDGVSDRYDNYYNRAYSSPRSYYGPRYVAPYGYRGGHWSVGNYLPSSYFGSSYYIDYRPYGLRVPPYGYRWNRVGNDVYLVSIRNGLIAEVVYDLFH
jgi:Ni/Co efflux regulator RcnB